MPDPGDPAFRDVGTVLLAPEDRKWLHDKYERLAAEEGQFATSRTSYYAAIGTVLVTAIVVAVADLESSRLLLVVITTFLAGLGILISLVWAVLLHRTNDALDLWRELARELEEAQPPIAGELTATATLRSGKAVPVNLLRPYQAHAIRFSDSPDVSWMDRVRPAPLTEALPIAFLVIWIVALAFAWGWYLV